METNQERTVTRIDPRDISALAKCAPRVSQLTALGNNVDLLGEQYQGKRVAIIGTRDPSELGRLATKQLARVVSANGGIIVSGLGIGVDTVAHQATLGNGGKTIAVLGSGIDHIYPSTNIELAKHIQTNGLIISEYDRDAKALAWHFPIRMRIISALADIVIVTESAYKGSARIGVDLAMAMDKPIYALPGAIDNPMAQYPNALISDGATPILDPSTILNAIGIDSDPILWDLDITNK